MYHTSSVVLRITSSLLSLIFCIFNYYVFLEFFWCLNLRCLVLSHFLSCLSLANFKAAADDFIPGLFFFYLFPETLTLAHITGRDMRLRSISSTILWRRDICGQRRIFFYRSGAYRYLSVCLGCIFADKYGNVFHHRFATFYLVCVVFVHHSQTARGNRIIIIIERNMFDT